MFSYWVKKMRFLSAFLLLMLCFISAEAKTPQEEETVIVNILNKAGNMKYSDWDKAKSYIDQAEALAEKSKNDEVKARFKYEAAQYLL